jgi:hypothetical protein
VRPHEFPHGEAPEFRSLVPFLLASRPPTLIFSALKL